MSLLKSNIYEGNGIMIPSSIGDMESCKFLNFYFISFVEKSQQKPAK